MKSLGTSLAARLAVEPRGSREFCGSFESFDGRVFGGEILAKAVMAAARTCGERPLHSFHAYFLNRATPERPASFHVAPLRDGRRLSGRRVAVEQDGRTIAELSASFTVSSEGITYQEPPSPSAPAPEGLPTHADILAAEGLIADRVAPVEWRYVEHPWRMGEGERSPTWRAWVRPVEPLPEDPSFHAAAFAYLSDYGSFGAVKRRFGEIFDWTRCASLDHVMWIHRPAPWRGWILMRMGSDIGSAGRGLTEATFHMPDGARVATMVQEALFEPAATP